MLNAFGLNFCSKAARNRNKALKLGVETLDQSLDVRLLVERLRALQILMRIFLSKSERNLIKIQKKEAILDMQ